MGGNELPEKELAGLGAPDFSGLVIPDFNQLIFYQLITYW
jgi:hypothetical protein